MEVLQLNDLKEEEIDLYLKGLGFLSFGEYEWKDGHWTIEYMGTDKEPWAWRFDDFDSTNSIGNMVFLSVRTPEELVWVVKSLTKSI